MRSKNWRAAFFLNVACLPFYAYIYATHFNVGTKAEQECGTKEDAGYNVGPGTTTRACSQKEHPNDRHLAGNPSPTNRPLR